MPYAQVKNLKYSTLAFFISLSSYPRWVLFNNKVFAHPYL